VRLRNHAGVLGAVSDRRPQNLESHFASQPRIGRSVDVAVSALTDLVADRQRSPGEYRVLAALGAFASRIASRVWSIPVLWARANASIWRSLAAARPPLERWYVAGKQTTGRVLVSATARRSTV